MKGQAGPSIRGGQQEGGRARGRRTDGDLRGTSYGRLAGRASERDMGLAEMNVRHNLAACCNCLGNLGDQARGGARGTRVFALLIGGRAARRADSTGRGGGDGRDLSCRMQAKAVSRKSYRRGSRYTWGELRLNPRRRDRCVWGGGRRETRPLGTARGKGGQDLRMGVARRRGGYYCCMVVPSNGGRDCVARYPAQCKTQDFQEPSRGPQSRFLRKLAVYPQGALAFSLVARSLIEDDAVLSMVNGLEVQGLGPAMARRRLGDAMGAT